MEKIHLPCLRGNFGEWVYFSTVMKISDIVEPNRVITVPESKELYSKNINEVLQREIATPRINQIKKYLLENKERFFSSLIVAIHKGNPQWADFDIERQFRIDNDLVNEKDVNFIENKLGILTLSGNEEIFVLDGQHRLLGMRKAFNENKELGKDEVSIIIVVHNQKLKEKTRRLFTVLNRYAVTIPPAEKIILEEDDASAILTRKLVQEYPLFSESGALSATKSFSLPPNDIEHFSTLVCLYEINKILIDYKSLYPYKVIIRPSDIILGVCWQKITKFWDFFFAKYPEVVNFIKGQKELNTETFNRNNLTGGSILLRPEGQRLFAEVYQDFVDKNKFQFFLENVQNLDFDLNGSTWKYIFWTGTKIETGNKKLKKAVFHFLLNNYKDENYVKTEIKKVYKKYNLDFDNSLVPVSNTKPLSTL